MALIDKTDGIELTDYDSWTLKYKEVKEAVLDLQKYIDIFNDKDYTEETREYLRNKYGLDTCKHWIDDAVLKIFGDFNK